MRTSITFTLATILLAAAATAHAEGYASAGQVEMGGTFQVANVTTKPDGGEEQTATAIQISPVTGYWVSSWFELLGSMDIRQTTVANGDSSITSVGIGAGPGAFLKLGNARLGPYVLAHVFTETVQVFGPADQTTSGPGATVGVQFKLPVAGGGVVVLGAAADYSNLKVSTETTEAQGTYTSFGTSVGFLGYF